MFKDGRKKEEERLAPSRTRQGGSKAKEESTPEVGQSGENRRPVITIYGSKLSSGEGARK